MLGLPVALTGLGAVTPFGVGSRDYVAALRAGRSATAVLPFTHPRMKSSVAAACAGWDPTSVLPEAEAARLPRLVPMALAAAREALAHAGLQIRPGDEDLARARRVGLILGTGGGGIDFTLDQMDAGAQQLRQSLWTITNATHGNLAGELSIQLGLRGPSYCLSTGCASSSDAVGMGMSLLRAPAASAAALDAVVVIGADAHIRWETISSMELLRVVSTRDFRGDPAGAHTASRPFDRTRDGFVLGEGAWAVVLERGESAASRGVRTIADMLGYAATCDAYHRVRPAPDMVESVRAMHLAVRDAGLEPGDIEVVHYHGTATPMNDALETAAVKAAFGAHAQRLVGHSVKGAIGHPQGACGLAALVATVGALSAHDGGAGAFLPATANLSEPDDACDLDYTPREPRAAEGRRTALVNCLAFGAKNSALVVRTRPAGS